MKRERRQKKSRQRGKQRVTEEKEKLKALKPGIAKKYKGTKESAALVKKLTKDKKISKMDETAEKVAKSSTAFFAKLQDQVRTRLKAQTVSVSNKKDRALSAVKLKL